PASAQAPARDRRRDRPGSQAVAPSQAGQRILAEGRQGASPGTRPSAPAAERAPARTDRPTRSQSPSKWESPPPAVRAAGAPWHVFPGDAVVPSLDLAARPPRDGPASARLA